MWGILEKILEATGKVSILILMCQSFLFAETVFKFKALKKPAQLSVIYNLEKVGGIIIMWNITAVCLI